MRDFGLDFQKIGNMRSGIWMRACDLNSPRQWAVLLRHRFKLGMGVLLSETGGLHRSRSFQNRTNGQRIHA